MLRNFSYVIDGVLAGSAHPAHFSGSVEDLHAVLREFGIGAVVSLDEVGLPDTRLERAGIDYLHLSIPDFHPPSLEQIESFVQFVDGQRARSEGTLVHCYAGMGRTGTMLACYLVKDQGLTAEEAIARVRRLRPGSIETFGQEDAIHAYAQRRAQQRPGS